MSYTRLSLMLVVALAFIVGCDKKDGSTAPPLPTKVTVPDKSATTNKTADVKIEDPQKGPNGSIKPETPKLSEADKAKIGKVEGGEGKEYTLKLNLPTGTKRTYSFTVDTWADPKGMKSDDPMRKTLTQYSSVKVVGEVYLTVKKVANGEHTITHGAKILSAVGAGDWRSQGEDLMSKPQEDQDFTWDQQMHNVNIAKDDFVDPLDNTLNGLLPKTPVKVGSKWSYLPFPNAAILTNVKVEKLETIQGIECLKLVIDTPSGNPGDKSDFLVWLDPVTGMYVRCELHTKGNMNGMVSLNDFVQTLKK